MSNLATGPFGPETRRQYIPCFDDFYGTTLDLIPYPRDATIKILDLGAGTGLLAALMAEAFPNAQITLLDISSEMLGKAQERFARQAEQAPRIHYHTLDYIHAEIPGRYDVIVSALSLHHSPPADLRAVFQKIYAALTDGGLFINADQVLGPTPALEAQYQQAWLRQIRQLGCTEHEIALALGRMQADRTSTLDDQLTWLKAAGFEQVDCWYKHYRFAVYAGHKHAA
ncbi:MAG: class I SAM-dependent methyltransferase [Chloroflexi bacterium]|nr:class I SAM-dependent methyltransferase [Chloroflexota bacterium]